MAESLFIALAKGIEEPRGKKGQEYLMIIQYILLLGNETKLLSDIEQELHNFDNVKVFYANSCQQALDYGTTD